MGCVTNPSVLLFAATEPGSLDVGLWACRGLLILIAVGSLVAILRNPQAARERWNDFFGAVTSPLNLAMFRIATFGTILFWMDAAEIRFFAGLPSEMLVGPFGMRWLPRVVPLIHEQTAEYGILALRAACVLSILGLFTRLSTIVGFVLTTFVLLIPQYYGKVNHYHHLVWFTGLLAMSRCGDARSVTAAVVLR